MKVRTPRSSAKMYGEIARTNALSEETVRQYAPSALNDVFPGRSREHERTGERTAPRAVAP